MGFSLIVMSGGSSAAVVRGLLIVVASRVVSHGPWDPQASVVATRRFNSFGAWV